MSVVLLAALAAQGGMIANTNSPPPPVIMPVIPPVVRAPPPPSLPPPFSMDWLKRPVSPIRVRVFAGTALLLDETLQVGPTAANFTMSRSEAASETCATPARYPRSRRTSLNVSLRPDGTSNDSFRVTFAWSRPTGGCATEGNLGVTVDQGLEIARGRTVLIQGDGGVRIELTR